MLRPVQLPAAERALYSRLRQVLTHPGVLRGSLVAMRRTCGGKNCRCLKGGAYRHRSLYLSLRVRGKPSLIYIPAEWEDRVREWTGRYAEVREMLERLSMACLDRLKRREE